MGNGLLVQTYFKEKSRKKRRIKWSKSKEAFCYLSGVWAWCEPHHVFNGNGKQREYSEKYGAVIYVTPEQHKLIHADKKLRDSLKREFQIKLMAEHNWSLDDWREIWTKSYL